MKYTQSLAYRVAGDYEDHKVIRVRQMNGIPGRLHDYKQHKYVRADIVEKMIDELANLHVKVRDYHFGVSQTQEKQVEKKKILRLYGLDE